ncbi:YkvI family membrane protein [Corynebacterium sphenisci]|uniref:YkvI family membrane protein n=1 Tax=Corynebacterium sphenisci TaxID=191493 RepID=UPI000B072454|nr:hypothetical protein [Corynebacterium sphenisci]
MLREALGIAMAVTGVIIGAGFASGQELLQYFVAFGTKGIIGASAAGIMMALAGLAMLQYGSYYRAREHTAVFEGMTLMPWTSRILDAAVLVTLFSTGFVMFAGAGSNLQQQFGLPVWVGSGVMLLLVLAAGMLDVDKVSRVIGGITPFILVFLLIGSLYAIIAYGSEPGRDLSVVEGVTPALPVWWLSAVNYTGLALIMGVSMAIVIGGANLIPRSAGIGGLIAGILFGAFLVLGTIALLLTSGIVAGEDMPMLALIESIDPRLGVAMAFIIYGMIFNSALGLFYALGKRLTAKRPERYRVVFTAVTVAGFILSFVGFKTLVAHVYPVLGYFGIVLVAIMVVAWFRARGRISAESDRRNLLRTLVTRRLDPRMRFTKTDRRHLERAVDASNVDDADLADAVYSEVVEELRADEEVDFPEYEVAEGDSAADAAVQAAADAEVVYPDSEEEGETAPRDA